jgi:hypothetical protein
MAGNPATNLDLYLTNTSTEQYSLLLAEQV